MKKLSTEEKISALYLCADILDYPDADYVRKLQNLKLISSLEEVDLDFVKSEHISIFSINATRFKCVPYASWWIDGKMAGVTVLEVSDFYMKCGYMFDANLVKKESDHISLMLVFVAILLEEKKLKELNEFIELLSWLNNFKNSLNKASSIKYFAQAVDKALQIIDSLKEEI